MKTVVKKTAAKKALPKAKPISKTKPLPKPKTLSEFAAQAKGFTKDNHPTKVWLDAHREFAENFAKDNPVPQAVLDMIAEDKARLKLLMSLIPLTDEVRENA